MKRVAILAVAIACACGELRAADRGAGDAGPTADAGPNVEANDATGAEGDTGPGRPDAGPDASIAIEPLVQSQTVSALALDDTNLYYSSGLGIFQCPKAGCSGAGLKLADTTVHNLAIADGKVFWADPDGDRIAACTIGGCASPTTAIANQTSPEDVVTNGAVLVWSASGAGTSRLRRAPIGGAATDVTPTDLSRRSIAIGGFKIVWCALDGLVRSCPFAGACDAPILLGSGNSNIAISETTAFWATGSAIVSCPLDRACGAPKTLTASSQAASLVADDRHVYWRDRDARGILRCPLGGCAAPEVFAAGVDSSVVNALAVDATHVYWNTADGIERAKKR